jgi:hypothetical protein
MSVDDSDDEDLFLPHIPICGDIEEEDLNCNGAGNPLSSELAAVLDQELQIIELSLLRRDTSQITKTHEKYQPLSNLVQDFLQGKYLSIVSSSPLSLVNFINICKRPDAIESITVLIQDYLEADVEKCSSRVFECLVLGFTYLELYCQMNYTGPELSDIDVQILTGDNDEALQLFDNALNLLECDGNYGFRISIMPYCLLIARVVLGYLADPSSASWKKGIYLDAEGNILTYPGQYPLKRRVQSVLIGFKSRHWLSARAVVIHTRLLQIKSYENIPSLWKESNDRFKQVLVDYCNDTHDKVSVLKAMAYLEWGLCIHFFEFGDKGKKIFQLAKEAIQLRANLSAAMGKRTKHQVQEYAQLLLDVKSALVDDPVEGSVHVKEVVTYDLKDVRSEIAESNAANPEGWQHSEWEVGRRAVREVVTGDEAALREVLLDSMDGGAVENILFEGGPRFSDENARAGDLHPLDQAIILALCLDVENSNPKVIHTLCRYSDGEDK